MLSASQQLKIALNQIKIQNDALCDATISQIRVQAEMEKHDVTMVLFTDCDWMC